MGNWLNECKEKKSSDETDHFLWLFSRQNQSLPEFEQRQSGSRKVLALVLDLLNALGLLKHYISLNSGDYFFLSDQRIVTSCHTKKTHFQDAL